MEENRVNYEQFYKERIISISDMIEEVFKKIWLILILAVICALVCAGYKFSQDKKTAALTENTVTTEDLTANLSEAELQRVRNVYELQTGLMRQEDYMEQSIAMQIDPYMEDRMVMLFSVQSPSVDDRENVLYALDTYINGGGLAADLHEKYPDETMYSLSELVTAQPQTQKPDDEDDHMQDQIDDLGYPNVDLLTVRVIHLDPDSCKDLADAVSDCILTYQERLDYAFPSCQIAKWNEVYTQIVDRDLQTYQSEHLDALITTQDRLNVQTQALSEGQKQMLTVLLSGEEASVSQDAAENDAGEPVKVSVSKKYMAIGILLGIVIGIVLILLGYVTRGTLNLALEFQKMFHLPTFGEVGLKGKGNILVRAFRTLTHKNKGLTLEEQKQLAIGNLVHACRGAAAKQILLAGTCAGLSEIPFVQEIKAALEKEGMKAEIADRMPWSYQALEQLEACEQVVLVETLHISRYDEIMQEIQKCMEHKIPILGTIVLN